MSNKPIDFFPLGMIKLNQWQQTNQEGKTYNTFSIQKSYKDNQDNWQNGNSFFEEDLLKIKQAIDAYFMSKIHKTKKGIATAQTQQPQQNQQQTQQPQEPQMRTAGDVAREAGIITDEDIPF